jgi:hypothetical protein
MFRKKSKEIEKWQNEYNAKETMKEAAKEFFGAIDDRMDKKISEQFVSIDRATVELAINHEGVIILLNGKRHTVLSEENINIVVEYLGLKDSREVRKENHISEKIAEMDKIEIIK